MIPRNVLYNPTMVRFFKFYTFFLFLPLSRIIPLFQEKSFVVMCKSILPRRYSDFIT